MNVALDPGRKNRTGTRKTLLVVEDEESIRWLLAHALRPEFRLRFAKTGERALEILLGPLSVDGALVNVRLPGMDGPEFIRKALQLRPGLPTFLMTAHDPRTAKRLANLAGARNHITKPFRLDALRMMIRRHTRASPP